MAFIAAVYEADFDAAQAEVFDESALSPTAGNSDYFDLGGPGYFYIGNPDVGFHTQNLSNGVTLGYSDAGYELNFADNLADVTLTGGTFADSIVGGRGNDLLQDGGAGRDTLVGGRGDDTLVIYGNGDKVLGGAGDDLIQVMGLHGPNAAHIAALSAGDVIDLRGAAAHDGAVSFAEVSHFDGESAEVVAVYHPKHGLTAFLFDLNGDEIADSKITIRGGDYSDYSHFAGVAASFAVRPDDAAPAVIHHDLAV